MPRRGVTVTDKTALFEQIKNQPPNTSHRQLAEATGVPTLHALHNRKSDCEMNGHYATDKRELPRNGSVKVRIQMLKEPLNQSFSIVIE
jgi:hypothetical protein